MENRQRKAKVTNWERDGEYITVRYTQEDGQRVEGDFYRVGWTVPPTDAIERAREALKKGPSYFVGSRRVRSAQ